MKTMPSSNVWDKIEAEKRIDRIIRRVSVIAWSVTFFLLLVFGGLVGMEVWRAIERARVGAIAWENVAATILPFLSVVGTVALLIAVLSTVGVFLRLRTASLSDIQLRLATLEEVLVNSPSEQG